MSPSNQLALVSACGSQISGLEWPVGSPTPHARKNLRQLEAEEGILMAATIPSSTEGHLGRTSKDCSLTFSTCTGNVSCLLERDFVLQ